MFSGTARKRSLRSRPNSNSPVVPGALRCCQTVPIQINLIPPRVRDWYFVPSAANARRAAVINLCDPAAYPQLYAPEYRLDNSHLNAAGAEILTRIVADRFVEIAQRISAAN